MQGFTGLLLLGTLAACCYLGGGDLLAFWNAMTTAGKVCFGAAIGLFAAVIVAGA